ncbi:MAG TPA: DUF4153 domain-containing protein, partial [Gemmatimonadales bacterium]|nr:DUF4153 domain-containing protein [Gemmatimonadales bacterium]
MRFPSLSTAYHDARDTAARFPLAILAGLGAVVVMFLLIEDQQDWHPRLLATLVLGLPLFIGSVTSAERRGTPAGIRWVRDGGIALALVLLYRGSLGWSEQHAFLRFAQLLIAGHLLVAVAPYLGRNGQQGFWQYNRFLLLRFLVAAFYAAVLWVGLSVALGALDKLFGADIEQETYVRLWALMAFGFHPWFFLSGMPRDYEALERLDDYPQGLKVFTQFVLMPLVVIYLAILTAYLGKVIVTTSWPSGWIGYLVSSVSVTGVLALLLVHPIRERADSRWVNAYARWWFVALLPALVMLLLAIGKRIDQYGITEPRYFLLVLALWMLAIALYYGITGSANIKRLPVSLCAVALLSAFGPWGAYAVAKRSQLGRFNHILAANGMGRAGAVSRAREPVALADRRELSAILRYLRETHGDAAIAEVMGVPLDTVRAWELAPKRGSDDAIASNAMERLGAPYVSRWASTAAETGSSFWAHYRQPNTIEVKGFEVMRVMDYPQLGWIGTAADSVELAKGDSGFVVVKRHGAVAITLNLAGAVRDAIPEDTLLQRGSGPLSRPIILEGSGGGLMVRWVIGQLSGRLVGGRIELQSANGAVLVAGLLAATAR